MLGLASCQTEPAVDVVLDGEQEVTLSVSLPETTRAVGTQDSAVGGVSNVLGEYDIRYILEVYNDAGVMVKERMTKTSDTTTTQLSLTVTTHS